MSPLPSSAPEIDTDLAGDIQIPGIDEQQTEASFKTLSSETARELEMKVYAPGENPVVVSVVHINTENQLRLSPDRVS